MSNRTIINAGILLVGVLGILLLTKFGCNSNSKEVDSIDNVQPNDDDHSHTEPAPADSVSEVEMNFPPSEYDGEIDAAMAALSKSQETGGMPAGIMELLAVSRKDSNNVRANYYLALFAIQSGQLEKAEKRIEKLILLQPENQVYTNMLSDLRQQQ